VIALGIYLLVTNQTYSFIIGTSAITAPIILIISGAATAGISSVGFIGACFKWRLFLVIFAIVVGVIALLELVAAVLGFVFRQSVLSYSADRYLNTWNDIIRRYRRLPTDGDYDESVNNAVDALQAVLQCCGTLEPASWGVENGDYIQENGGNLPTSCDCTPGMDLCNQVSFNYTYNTNLTDTYTGTVWTRGCFNATVDAAVYIGAASGAISLIIAFLEIIGVVIAITLCACITHKRKQEFV
jgi:uncharacterized membrane protein